MEQSMSNNEVETPKAEAVPDSKSGEVESAKPKKKTCRRGKKRKYKSPDAAANGESSKDDTSELYWHSETAECKKRAKNVLIRPVDAPKAPKNSTQFIMDDHDECHLYMSFETPDPYHTNNNTPERVPSCSTSASVEVEDAAYQDIDYVYHSMQDRDNSAYYLQDFEVSYSNMRYEELLGLTKPDLITALESLESRIKEIESKLYEQDPCSALEQLQRKLLQLQEEHTMLFELNVHLKNQIQNVESCDIAHSVNQPDREHSISEDSLSCEGCDECNDNDSLQEPFAVRDNSAACNLPHNSPINFSRYKDLMHLPIERSSDSSSDERNGDLEPREDEQQPYEWDEEYIPNGDHFDESNGWDDFDQELYDINDCTTESFSGPSPDDATTTDYSGDSDPIPNGDHDFSDNDAIPNGEHEP